MLQATNLRFDNTPGNGMDFYWGLSRLERGKWHGYLLDGVGINLTCQVAKGSVFFKRIYLGEFLGKNLEPLGKGL